LRGTAAVLFLQTARTLYRSMPTTSAEKRLLSPVHNGSTSGLEPASQPCTEAAANKSAAATSSVPRLAPSVAPSPPKNLEEQPILLEGRVFGRTAKFLVDSGASGNFVSLDFVRRHHLMDEPVKKARQVILADGKSYLCDRILRANLEIANYYDQATFNVI